MAAPQTDAQVAEICRLAFEAGHHSKFQEAYDHHGRAIVGLNNLADNAKLLDRERKRIARKQAKFHGTRRELLQQILSGKRTGIDVVLPSSISARENLAIPINASGLPCLSLDELLLSKSLKPFYDKAQAGMPQGSFVSTKQVVKSFMTALKDNPALITPEIQHILTQSEDGTISIPFYTPSLDKSLPEIKFHVYMSSENVFTSGRWFYFKVKDSSEWQVLYILQGLKRRRYQVNHTQLSRATEFTSPCVQTLVTPVQSTGSRMGGGIGRQLTHITSSPFPVVDKPDRTKHIKWEPRRMTWGGRNFVWKQGKKTLETELCEIKREWPQPGSKTGKMLDECFESILHVQTKFAIKKAAVFTFRYGTGNDFLFRELIFASLLSYFFIIGFGHDD